LVLHQDLELTLSLCLPISRPSTVHCDCRKNGVALHFVEGVLGGALERRSVAV
jgi:hypothetical protein